MIDRPLEELQPVQRQLLNQVLRGLDTSGEHPLFIDFDQTLFSSNSTELFIQSCKPSLLVALIDFIIRELLPWKFLGIRNWARPRDFICCAVIVLISPWNLLIWQRIAPAIFSDASTQDLAKAVAKAMPKNVFIISFGMEFIIRPLLRNSVWATVDLIATPSFPLPSHFLSGKLEMALAKMSLDRIAASTFVTDSEDDADLLSAVKHGYLIEPQGPKHSAVERLYIPLRYTFRAKYPRFYFFDQLVLVDMALAAIATAHDPQAFFRELLFLPMFVLSLMCVYEIGYFENDIVAAKKEVSPTLTENVRRYQLFPIFPGAWIWALLFAAMGSWVAWELGSLHQALTVHAISWIAALAAIRLTFVFYNRQPVDRRIYIYPLLQLEKYSIVFLVVSPTLVGGLLIFCQIIMMWTIYLIYRLKGSRPIFERELYRTILFMIGAFILLANDPRSILADSQFSVLAAAIWSILRLCKPFVTSRTKRRL
jgi:hypothetical protein